MLRGAVVTLVVLLLWVAPASASFPGANGELAIDPPDGHGIVLADLNGQVSQQLCPVPRGFADEPCTGISDASWSPDGQELVFAQGGRLSVVYSDGSCLDCTLQTYLAPPSSSPVFLSDGSDLLLAQTSGFRGRLPTVASAQIDGLDYTPLKLRGAAGEPASGPTGEFAFVLSKRGRSTVMFARRGGARPVRIALGRSPDISPSGRTVAFVRRGWVWLDTLRGGMIRRLVRGHDPVFSPDGTRLAFLSRRGAVRTISVAGGRPRSVGHLHGSHVDWQPIVKSPPRCPLPSGSQLIAAGQATQIYSAQGEGYLACLSSPSRLRVLQIDLVHARYTLEQFAFFGTSVAYVSEQFQDYPVCQAPLDVIVELNLSTGTSPLNDFAADGCYGGPDQGGSELDSWVVDTDGAIAFLATQGNGSGTYTYTLTGHDGLTGAEANGARLLDSESTSSATSPITDLAVSGDTVTWRHSGITRSATLVGSPRPCC